MSSSSSSFSAKEPTLGYLYQLRYGLLLLLRAKKEVTLRIENLDDIELEDPASIDLFQAKLKIKSKANLTDASVDFWKTMRVWADAVNTSAIDVDTTSFTLITTESVSSASLLFDIKKENKTDVELAKIISKLDKVATTSSNVTNKAGYDEYLKLPLAVKEKLIKRITIADSSLDIDKITSSIESELTLFVQPSHMVAFVELLEGWWFSQIVMHLMGSNDGVRFSDLQLKVSEIIDQFALDNLPNHFTEQLEIDDDEVEKMKAKAFIRQLEAISINSNSQTTKRAISDFRRAFDQRSKWIRLQLLTIHEQESYDNRLKDHWRNLFDTLIDECAGLSDEEVKKLAKTFYIDEVVKKTIPIRIRDRFSESYLNRGSMHILSDIRAIGWHPEFKSLVG